MGFLEDIKAAWYMGWTAGQTNILSKYNKYYGIDDNKTDTMPYYIDDQVNALYAQIQAIHRSIDLIDSKIDLQLNNDKIVLLECKKANLLYKVAKLEEKVYKLLVKYD